MLAAACRASACCSQTYCTMMLRDCIKLQGGERIVCSVVFLGGLVAASFAMNWNAGSQ
jgi:hypothetical protein